MKIALIGPGIMPIPCKGWGAVEILIWDYYSSLSKKGHVVTIFNEISPRYGQNHPTTPYCKKLIKDVNSGNFDFVHIHYDCMYHLVQFLQCPKIGFTSHYPYINNPEKHHSDGFTSIFQFMIKNNDRCIQFVLAQKDIDYLVRNGANPKYIRKLENGVNANEMFCDINTIGTKTIYLGKISERKKQHIYCHLRNIDIIGPNQMYPNMQNYKGSWTREQVYTNLTKYGNLLLISSGEADPLVVKEAMMAGLGVVVNAVSAKNLETCPFITILDDSRILELDYVQEKINENLRKCVSIKGQIREYAENHYSWDTLITPYLDSIF